MRFVRRFGFVPALAFAVGVAWAVSASAAAAYSPMVTIIDNDAPTPNQGFDVGTGYWGFGPEHITVKKGESVTFVSPATNKRPHSVTSIALGAEGPFAGAIASGTTFDSSPAREALITPGNSWALDTSGLNAGHYAYYCRIHPWMVARISVTE